MRFNERQIRTLKALINGPMMREQLDMVAGASNGPEVVAGLRKKGLNIICERVPSIDRDGKPCRPGRYYLSEADKEKAHELLNSSQFVGFLYED